ncbi:MAG: hypothetical protein HY816_05845 [Candidatus Wallbacteria bacterium]|nr:hypothetical protein [Candidatus Wallbacteria bacterium]
MPETTSLASGGVLDVQGLSQHGRKPASAASPFWMRLLAISLCAFFAPVDALAQEYRIPVRVTTTGDKSRRTGVRVRILNTTTASEVSAVSNLNVNCNAVTNPGEGTFRVSLPTTQISTGDTLKFFLSEISNGISATAHIFDTGVTMAAAPGPITETVKVLPDPSGEINTLTGTIVNASSTQVPGVAVQASVIHFQSTAVNLTGFPPSQSTTVHPDFCITQGFAELFPGTYIIPSDTSVDGLDIALGPIAAGDAIRLELVYPQTSSAVVADGRCTDGPYTTRTCIPQPELVPSSPAGEFGTDLTLSRAITSSDLNQAGNVVMSFLDPNTFVGLTYSTDRRFVGTDELTITATFFNQALVVGESTFLTEPLNSTPTLIIDRPGTSDDPGTVVQMSPVSDPRISPPIVPFIWTAKYTPAQGNRSTVLDGIATVTVNNATDYGNNQLNSATASLNTTFNLITTPPRATLSYSKGDASQNPPHLPITGDPFAITVVFDTRIDQTATPTITIARSSDSQVIVNGGTLIPLLDDITNNQGIYVFNFDPDLAGQVTGNYKVTLAGAPSLTGVANETAPTNDTFFLDNSIATGTITFSASPKIPAGSVTITATFDQAVDGPVIAIERPPYGSGSNDVSTVAMTKACGSSKCTVWTHTYTVLPDNGSTILDRTTPLNEPAVLTISQAVNVIGNSSNTITATMDIDTKTPDITLTYSAVSPFKGSPAVVTITATASEDMGTVPNILITGGTASALNDINPAQAMTQIDLKTFTFLYAFNSGDDGNFTVTLSNAFDVAGNALATTNNRTFAVDARPEIASLVYSKASQTYGQGSFVVTATFTEAITTSFPTIQIAGGGAGNANDVSSTAMTVSGPTRTIWTFSRTVTPTDDGAFDITLTAKDDSGQDLLIQPTNRTFLVDTSVPTAIINYNKTTQNYAFETLLLTATFSEPITPSDPSLTIAGGTIGNVNIVNAGMSEVAPFDRTAWTFQSTLAPGDIDGNRTISLSASDLAGNAVGTPGNRVFVVDSTPPAVNSVTYSKTSAAYRAETFQVTVTFSESITPGSPSISLSGGSGANTNDVGFTPMTLGSDRQTWSFSRTVIGGGVDDGTFNVGLTASDAAGNTLAGAIPNSQFQIDTVAPVVALLEYNKVSQAYSAETFQVTATFSEDITPVSPQIQLAGGGAGTNNDVAASSMIVPGADLRVWNFSRTVIGASVDDGSFGLTLTATDNAGNALASQATNNTFTVDTARPTVALSYSKSSSAVSSGVLIITATFNEDIAVGPSLSIDRPGSGGDLAATAMSATPDAKVWLFFHTVTVQDGTTFFDGAAIATVSGGQDAAGNLNLGASNNSFTIDTVAPTPTLTFNQTNPFVAGALTITATFSEVLSTTPTIRVAGPSGVNNQGPTLMTNRCGAFPCDTWSFSYPSGVQSGNDGSFTVTLSTAQDAAGNNSVQASNRVFGILTQPSPPRSIPIKVINPGIGLSSRRQAMRVRAFNTTIQALAGTATNVVLGATTSISVSGVSTGDSLSFYIDQIQSSNSVVSTFVFDTGHTYGVEDATATIALQILTDPSGEVDLTGFLRTDQGAFIAGKDIQLTLHHFEINSQPFTGNFEQELVFPTIRRTQSFAELFPGKYSASDVGPLLVGDAVKVTLREDASGPQTPLGNDNPACAFNASDCTRAPSLYPDPRAGSPANDRGYPSVDVALGRALVQGDFTPGVDVRLDWLDPSFWVGLTYSKDRTLVNSGPLQITATFYNSDYAVQASELIREPLATTPSLFIDRQGSGDTPCCYEMKMSGTDPSIWTTTYQVVPANRTTIQDGSALVRVTNAVDFGGNTYSQTTTNSQNTSFDTLTVPALATLTYSRGKTTLNPPQLPAFPMTITVTFDQQITQASRPKIFITSSNSIPSVNDVNGNDLIFVSAAPGQSIFSFNYTPTATSPVNGASLAGTYIVTPTQAFNLVGLENDRTPVQPLFDLDISRATPTLSYSKSGFPATTVAAGDMVVTAKFNEPVQGPVILIDRQPLGVSVNDVQQTPMTNACGTGLCDTWTFTYNVITQTGPNSNIRDGTAFVTVKNGVNEVGNTSVEPGVNRTFTIDTIRPLVARVEASPPRVAAGTNNLTYNVWFNEAMSTTALPVISVLRPGTAAATSVTLLPGTTLGQFSGTMSVQPAGAVPGLLDGPPANLVTVLSAQDLAGNSVVQSASSTGTAITTQIATSLTFSPSQTSYGANQVVSIFATFPADRNAFLTGITPTSATPALLIGRPASKAGLPITTTTLVPLVQQGATNVWQGDYTVLPSNTALPDGTIPLDGQTSVGLIVQDDVGNPAAISGTSTFEIDGTAPVVRVALSPASPITNGPLVITAEFFKTTGGARESVTQPTVSISADATRSATCPTTDDCNALTPTSMVQAAPFDGTVWTYTHAICVNGANDGCFQVHVNGGQDGSLNANIDPALSFDIRTLGPQVVLEYSQSPAAVGVGGLTITATFSADIAASSTPSIAIDSQLSSVPGNNTVALTSMTRVTPQTYTFTYPLGIRAGHDGPFLVSITGARDLADNPNQQPPANRAFTVKTAAPSVFLDYRQDGISGSSLTAVRDGTVLVTATFSEPVTPTAPDITITGAAPAPVTAMTGTPGTTVWTYSWSVPAGQNGTATVTVAGKNASGVTNGLPAFNSTMRVDTTSPTASIAYNPNNLNAATATITTGTVTVQATFDELLDTTPTFRLDLLPIPPGTPQITSGAVTRISSRVYGVPFNVASGATNGTYRVRVLAAQDFARNSGVEPATNSSVIVDTVQPQITQLVFSKDTTRPIGPGALTVTATFSEQLAVTPTFRILQTVPNSGRLLPGTVLNTGSRTVFAATFTIGGADEGDWRVSIIDGQDFATNRNIDADLSKSPVFTVDVTALAASIIYPPYPRSEITRYSVANPFPITVTFNKTVVNSPTLQIAGGTVATVNDASGTLSVTATPNRTVFVFNGYQLRTGDDGLFNLAVKNAQDRSLALVDPPLTNSTFRVDTVTPTATLSLSRSSPVSAVVQVVTATFSEPLVVTPTVQIAGANGSSVANDQPATPMTATGNAAVWTFAKTILATANGIDDDVFTVTVRGGTDAAGNEAPAPSSGNSFRVDTVAPNIAFGYSRGSPVTTGPLDITLTATEPLAATPRITISGGGASTANDRTGQLMSSTSDAKVFGFHHVIASGDDGAFAVSASGVVDFAGNTLGSTSGNSFTVDGEPSAALTYSRAGTVFSTGSLTLTATFDETLSVGPNIRIRSPVGTAANTVTQRAMTSLGDGRRYTFTYAGGLVAETAAGTTVTYIVDITGALDSVGNPAQPASNNVFVVDHLQPRVTSSALLRAGVQVPSNGYTHVSSGSISVVAIFGERIAGAPLLTVARVGGGSTLNTTGPVAMTFESETSNSSRWSHTYPLVSGGDGDFLATIASALDSAGNTSVTSTIAFSVDATRPRVTGMVYSKGRTAVSSGPLALTATFGEPIFTTPFIQLVARTGGSTANVFGPSSMQPVGSYPTANFTFDADILAETQAGVDYEFQITQALDRAENVVAATDIDERRIYVDTRPPTGSLVFDKNPAVFTTGARTLTATFTEPLGVTPVLQIVGGSVGSTANDITPSAMASSATTRSTWTFTIPGGIKAGDDGRFQVTFTGGADLAGNPLAITPTGTSVYDVDTVAPTVAAIDYSRPIAPFTNVNAGPLSLTITFSEPLTVTPTVTISGGTASTLNDKSGLMSRTAVASVWTFAYPGSGVVAGDDGTFTVGVAGGQDAAGNANSAPAVANRTFVIDTAAPTVLSIARSRPVAPLTKVSAGTLVYTATFSEPLAQAPSISVAGGGAGTANDLGSQTMLGTAPSTVWTFTQTLVTGDDGTFTISIANGRDLAANANAAVSSGNTFLVDTAGPTVTGVVYSRPISPFSLVNAGAFTLTATFSEPMGATPSMQITGGSGASVANDIASAPMAASTTSTLWTFTYPGSGIQPGDDGVFNVTFPAGGDTAGNPVALAPAAGGSFVVDTVQPAVVSIVKSRPVAPFSRVNAGPLTLTATFTKDLEVAPSIAIAGGAADPSNDRSATLMSRPTSDKKVWSYTYPTGIAANDDGLFAVSISGGRDSAGNSNLPPLGPDAFFTVDTRPPAIVQFARSTPVTPFSKVGAGPTTYVATFDEPIVTTPTISVTGGGASTANDLTSRPMLPTSTSTIWTFTQNFVTGDDGSFAVSIASGNDAGGNANQALASNNTFVVDATAPTVTSISYDKPVAPLTRVTTGTLNITVLFSEALSGGAPAPVMTLSRPGAAPDVRPMTATGNAAQWTLAYTVTRAAGGVGDGTVTVSIDAFDGANNRALPPGTGASFVVDTLSGSATLAYSARDSQNVPPGPLRITAAFTEPLAAPPQIALVGFPGANNVGPLRMTASGDPAVFTFDTTIVRDNPGIFSVLLLGAQDLAGNAITQFQNGQIKVDPNAPATTLRYSRGPNGVTSGPLTITAEFSKPIVTTPLLNITGPAGANNVVSQPMTRVDTSTFRFVKNIVTGNDGRFTVSVAGAQDTAGIDAGPPADTSLVVDTTPPSVSMGYSRNPPVFGAGTVRVTATFSEPIASGVRPSLSLFLTSGLLVAEPRQMTVSTTRTVFFFDLPFAAGEDGFYDISVQGGTDAAGNANRAPANNRFEIDTTPPGVVLDYNRPVSAVPSGLLAITATFTEPLTSAPTISISGPPGANNRFATPMTRAGSDLVYTYATNIVPGNSGAFTVAISDALDRAGNSNSAAVNSAVDIVAANVAVALEYSRNPAGVPAGPLTLTASFGGVLSALPTLSIAGPAGANNAGPASMSGPVPGSVFALTRTIVAGNDGAFNVSLGNVRDQVGNTTVSISGGRFTVDTVRPTVALSYDKNPTAVGRGPLTITALCSEQVANRPLLALSGPAGPNNRSALPMLGAVPGNLFTFVLDVQVGNDGLFTAAVSGASDVAGNENLPATNATFVIATVAPSAVLTYSSDPAGVGAGLLTLTATYDQPLLGAPTISIAGPAGFNNRSPVQMTRVNSSTYVFLLPVVTGNDGEFTVTLAGAISAAGLSGTAVSNSRFTIDTTPPVLLVSDPAEGRTVGTQITVGGSVSDLTPSVVRVSSPSGAFATATLAVDAGAFTGVVNVNPQATTVAIELALQAVDRAGNRSAVITRRVRFDTDGDGMPDDFEFAATLARTGQGSVTGLDPSADDDSDGLSNLQEYAAGTDPEQSDTDDDGVADGAEVQAGTDPARASDNRPTVLVSTAAPLVDPGIVAFDASRSFDPRGRTLTYAWSQLIGAPLASSIRFQTTAAKAVALADLKAAGEYFFAVSVGNGSTFRVPPTSTVGVTIRDLPPRARAGLKRSLSLTGDTTRTVLDGGRSFDPNGDTVSYSWQMTKNPGFGATVVGGADTASPVIDFRLPGAYEATLTVRSRSATAQGTGTLSASEGVLILVGSPTARVPIASAGIDQEVLALGSSVDELVTLFGRDSVDPDRPTTDPTRPTLEFQWRQISGPVVAVADRIGDARGQAASDAYRSVDPTVRLRAAGEYVFGLTVRKRFGAGVLGLESAEDTVTVKVLRLQISVNKPPRSNAGFDRLIGGFDVSQPPRVILNGSGSSDPEQAPETLRFRWNQERFDQQDLTPEIMLSDPSSARPEFVPPAPGNYRFRLVVTDNGGIDSLPAFVNVQVVSAARPLPPVIGTVLAVDAAEVAFNFARPAQITTGTTPVIFLQAQATDPSGATLSYRWVQDRESSTAATVTLDNDETARASFKPLVSGVYAFKLLVWNGELSAESRVTVPVDDLRPGKNAGLTPVIQLTNTIVNVAGASGGTIVLDAGSTFDRDSRIAGRVAGVITYLWRQISGPVRLTFDRSSSSISLLLESGAVGTYVFEVVLDDGQDAVVQQVSFKTTVDSTGGTPPPDSGGGTTPPAALELAVVEAGGGGGGCAMATAGGSPAALPDLLMLLAGFAGAATARRRRRGETV